jgi:cell division protein FtsI/penicillin-binding protein 2
VHIRAMRRGHFIILVGGAIMLFLLLILAEVLSLVGSDEQVEEIAGLPEVKEVRSKTVRLPADRGEILDREGRLLASTEEGERLRIFLDDLVEYYREELGKSVPELRQFVSVDGEREVKLEEDVYAVAHEVLVMPLRERDVELKLRTESILEHYRKGSGEPFLVEVESGSRGEEGEGFDLEEWVSGVGGVRWESYGKRVYAGGAVTGSAVGLIDLGTGKGVRGVELRMDGKLEGTPGEAVMEYEVGGEEEVSREISREEAIRGEDVTLALDLELQRAVWESMAGIETGTAVVMDAGSGEVFVQISKPEYDPNEVLAGGMGGMGGLPLDGCVQARDLSGVAGVMSALLLLGESGGDEGLVEGLVKGVLEPGEGELEGGELGEMPGMYGMEVSEGGVLKVTPMELVLLGSSLVNGGEVLEPRVSGGEGGEAALVVGNLAEGAGVSSEALERLMEELLGGGGGDGEEAILLSGEVDGGEGAWILFATVGEGARYCGCVIDVEGRSLSLKGVGLRVLREVLEWGGGEKLKS